MMRSIRSLGTTAMIAGLTAALVAQGAPKINVKMGLWEVTSTTNMSGDVPMPDTSQMTPQQAAAIKAAMGGMMGPHTTTVKQCLTKEKFDQGMLTDQKNCKTTIATNTATVLEVQMACDMGQGNQGKMSGLMHFEAPTPDTMAGTFKGTSSMGAQTMNITGTYAGKWVAADCGAVK
jgi:hypothetical protein